MFATTSTSALAYHVVYHAAYHVLNLVVYVSIVAHTFFMSTGSIGLPEGTRIAGDKCICILATRTAVLTATRVRSKI